tara:strand:+ start:209 stop:382 length:174 start_codon:yes stop_codon:yes gene_type:complete
MAVMNSNNFNGGLVLIVLWDFYEAAAKGADEKEKKMLRKRKEAKPDSRAGKSDAGTC